MQAKKKTKGKKKGKKKAKPYTGGFLPRKSNIDFSTPGRGSDYTVNTRPQMDRDMRAMGLPRYDSFGNANFSGSYTKEGQKIYKIASPSSR